MTIITVDGNHIVANSYSNPGLDVITSVTYRMHPSTPFSAAFLLANSTNPTSTWNLLTEIVRLTPPLIEHGYGGYGGGSVDQLQFFILSPNTMAEETQAVFTLFDTALSQEGLQIQNSLSCSKISGNSMTPSGTQTVKSAPRRRFYLGCYPKRSSRRTNPNGWPGSFVSFRFSPPGKRSGSPRISFSPISLVTGGEVSRVDLESTGLNPVWRNRLVYATLGTGWEDGVNSTQIEAARQLLIQDMKILEDIAPESGAYLNEVRIARAFHTDLASFSYSTKKTLTGRSGVYRLLGT